MQTIGSILAVASLRCHSADSPSKNIKTKIHGLPITIEHPRGSVRILHDDTGKQVYRKRMLNDYGYFHGTKGRDGDEVDVMLGPLKDAKFIYVVHMRDLGPVKSEREDEDKCMVGFPSAESAKAAFLLHYPVGFFESMTVLPVDTFKEKMKTASLPYRHKKIHARGKKCPHCGGKKYGLMPTDFETAKCSACGRTFEVGAGVSNHTRSMVNRSRRVLGTKKAILGGMR